MGIPDLGFFPLSFFLRGSTPGVIPSGADVSGTLELFLASLGSDKGKQVQKDDKGEDFLTADDSLE
jgi:hypothetical protein